MYSICTVYVQCQYRNNGYGHDHRIVRLYGNHTTFSFQYMCNRPNFTLILFGLIAVNMHYSNFLNRSCQLFAISFYVSYSFWVDSIKNNTCSEKKGCQGCHDTRVDLTMWPKDKKHLISFL